MADDAPLFDPDKPDRELVPVPANPKRGKHAPGLGTAESATRYRNRVPLGGSERALPDWLDES